MYVDIGVGRLMHTWGPQQVSSVPVDPLFANVVLLLHCDGADGSTTFTDSSSFARSVTAVGNAQLDTAQFRFGGASLLLDGAGDNLSVPASSAWNLSVFDATCEAFIRPTGSAGGAILDSRDPFTGNGWYLIFLADNSLYLQATGTFLQSAPGVIARNAWQHVAWSKQGATHRLFVNGILVASSSSITVGSNVDPLLIGRIASAGSPFFMDGHIDEIRITRDAVRYTADFTPPTAPFPDA